MAGSPLLGYNTNVRHSGKLYHIQTEDSGSGHGHIFTHLFADGGRIIASKKTTYAQYIGTSRYPDAVKLLMKESHKAMFIALRDGLFDGDEAEGARAMADVEIRLPDSDAPGAAGTASSPGAIAAPEAAPAIDEDALERAAAARLAEADASQSPSQHPTAGRYQSTRPATAASPTPARSPKPAPRPDPTSESIFGGDLLSEKSLDEVIMSYLAEDIDE